MFSQLSWAQLSLQWRDSISSSQLCNYEFKKFVRCNRNAGCFISVTWIHDRLWSEHGVYLSADGEKRVESSMIIKHNSPLPLLVFQRSLKWKNKRWQHGKMQPRSRRREKETIESRKPHFDRCLVAAFCSHTVKPPCPLRDQTYSDYFIT